MGDWDMDMVKINQFVPFSPFSISVRPNICGTKYDGRVMLRVRSLNRSFPGCARPPVFSNFLIKCTQQSSCVAIGPVISTVHCPLSASILMNLPRKTLFIITSAPSLCSQGRTSRGASSSIGHSK